MIVDYDRNTKKRCGQLYSGHWSRLNYEVYDEWLKKMTTCWTIL